MYQRHTAWMDGVGHVTEPSIEPGTSFDYIFEAKPIGTHWYHSHVGVQRTDGMYAALVVRGDNPPDSSELIPEENGNAIIIDIPETNTFTIVDFQRESSLDLFVTAGIMGFTRDAAPLQLLTGEGITPVVRGMNPDGSDLGPIPFFSALINGRGRFQNTVTPLSEFSVTGGTYILFRIVGAIDSTAQMFSVDGHTLRVIASDGKDIEFVDVDYINVEAGERYDFLVNASQITGNYWIRSESQQVNVPNGTEYSARAILSYEGAESLDWRNGYANVPEARLICTPERPCLVLNCPFLGYGSGTNMFCVSLLDLVPRPRKPQEDLPKFPPNENCIDCMHFLNFGFAGPDGSHSVNANSLELPTLAYQTNCGQYDEDNSPDSPANTCEKNCTEGSCKCVHVIPVANQRVYKDDVAEDNLESIVMVFSGIPDNRSHPIHMHGHAFQVVYIGYGTYNEDGVLVSPTTDIICDDPCTNPRWRNGVPADVLSRTVDGKVTNAAIQKDTVVIPAGGYVVVAFKADNPGYWYIHCHIEGHTFGGMIVIMQEYPPDQQWLPPPGINDREGFTWTIEEFNEHIDEALTCATILPSSASADEITISKAGFGIALAILILLAIACVILLVLLIVFCILKKKKPEKGFDKVELSPK